MTHAELIHTVNGKALSEIEIDKDDLSEAYFDNPNPTLLVLDEEGINVGNGSLKAITDNAFIYVDDVNGFSLMDLESVKRLNTVNESEHVG
jgi:hypothetical protein